MGTRCASVCDVLTKLLLAALAATSLLSTGCLAGDESETDVESDVAEQNESKQPAMLANGAEKRRLTAARKAGDDVATWQRKSVHLGNAFWLAKISELAYLESEREVEGALARLGVEADSTYLTRNKCTGAAALYVQVDGYGVLAFRGTEAPTTTAGRRDWEINLDHTKVEWAGPGMIHRGFEDQLSSLDEHQCLEGGLELAELLTEAHGSGGRGYAGSLYLTGHSLGGALATLYLAESQAATCGDDSMCLDAPPLDIAAVYTFGQPKVGNEEFAHAVADRAAGRTPYFRFVHGDDPVTAIPRDVDGEDDDGEYAHVGYEGKGEAIMQVWLKGDEISIASFKAHALVNWEHHHIGEKGYLAAIRHHAQERGELR